MIVLPDDIDVECYYLCRALNSLPGLDTIESCCGHGKEKYRIWFRAAYPKTINPLIRMLYEHPGWECSYHYNKTHNNYYWCLTYNDSKGKKAYEEAIELRNSIYRYLSNRQP